MWVEFVAGLCPEAVFHGPASEDEIESAAARLGGSLPDPLVSLLRESDGVQGDYGHGLIWPLHRIVADNILFRTNTDFRDLYMPFDPLLFFADAGNGDQFAFVWQPRRDEIFVWNHEDDSRRWAAQSLERYLEWWLNGTLKV